MLILPHISLSMSIAVLTSSLKHFAKYTVCEKIYHIAVSTKALMFLWSLCSYLFAGGVGIQMHSHIFDLHFQILLRSALGAFECEVLEKMSSAIILGSFVS